MDTLLSEVNFPLGRGEHIVQHGTCAATTCQYPEGPGSWLRLGQVAGPAERRPASWALLFYNVEDELEDYGPILALRAGIVDHRDELIVQVVHVEVRQPLAVRSHLIANL